MDVLEEVQKPASRRRQVEEEVEEIEPIDEEPEDIREQPDDEDDRPRKKKKQKASEVIGPVKTKFETLKGLHIFGMVVCAALAIGGLVFIVLTAVLKEPGFICGSVLMIPLGILGFIWCMSLLTLKVVLHEGGIAHSRNGKRRLISWFEIKSVWQQITEHYTNGVYTGTTYLYTIQLEDGTRYKFSNGSLARVEKLGQAIMDMTARAIYPLAMRAYEKGEVVEFGTLALSKKGIYYGSSLLKWRDIDAVKINGGYISVSKSGKWFSWCNIAASSVPNLYVFLSMVNEIVGLDNG